MSIRLLFAATAARWPVYQPLLESAFARHGLIVEWMDESDAAQIDYIIYAPDSALTDFTPFINCKAVLSLWAGVERIIDNPTLTQPLCRMVDAGMTEGMVEWVVGHVMRHHIGVDRYVQGPNGDWDRVIPPLARERKIAVLGLGQLGTACAQALAALNFRVEGWSRNPKSREGMVCHHGDAGLQLALSEADMAVLLLPQTPQTDSILNAQRLALMKRGGVVLNPGRGPLVDDDALLAALDDGQIGHATLDVFRVEPLPPEHPFWHHPKITITPHVASETRPITAAQVIARNIAHGEAGEPFEFLANPSQGY